jgi:hypothetical protein
MRADGTFYLKQPQLWLLLFTAATDGRRKGTIKVEEKTPRPL